MELKKLLVESLENDTRDQSAIYVYRLKNRTDYKTFKKIQATLKALKCYYSGFKKGFICKEKLDLEDIQIKNSDIKNKTKETSTNIKYSKLLKDYITKDSLIDFIKNNWCKDVYNTTTNYWIRQKSLEEYTKNFLENESDILDNFDSFELKELRQVIIHKSLSFDFESLSQLRNIYLYKAIYENIPTIKDLKLIDSYYTAIWGYDQTNVSVAQQLNKKAWGLDVFKDLTDYNNYYFVRLKENRFSDKNKVRYYSKDSNYKETFKMDASVTGHYR